MFRTPPFPRIASGSARSVYWTGYPANVSGMVKKFIAVPVVALVLTALPVSADDVALPDAGMLPDSPLYFLDRLSEELGLIFAFKASERAERRLAIAAERLSEAKELVGKGKGDDAAQAVEDYQDDVDASVAEAKKAKDAGEEVAELDELLAKLAETAARHQEVLAEVYQKVPEQAKDAIKRAMEMSAKGHDEALRAVSGEKRDEIRERVREVWKEAEEHLGEFRAEGVPVPDLVDSDIYDLMDTEDELNDLKSDIEEVESEGTEMEDGGGAGRSEGRTVR